MDYIKSYPNLMKDIFHNVSYFLVPNSLNTVSPNSKGVLNEVSNPLGTALASPFRDTVSANLNKVSKPRSKRISYKSLCRFIQTCKLFRDIGNKRFDEILKIKKNENFYKLCRKGDKIIYYLLEDGKCSPNKALLASVKGCNLKFCKYFISLGANNFNECILELRIMVKYKKDLDKLTYILIEELIIKYKNLNCCERYNTIKNISDYKKIDRSTRIFCIIS